MTKIRHILLSALFLSTLGGFQVAAAATITTTLGNTTSGFNDGDIPDVFPDVIDAQIGQDAPFNTSCGGDVIANGNCSTGWLFSYGAPADPILSASLTLGIVDHDSAAGGSQLSLFTLDGNSLTAALDAQFEAVGDGLDGMYNVYTIDLAGFFADLADGSALISLALQGNGLQTCTLIFICPGAPVVSETDFNGANLIFSTLTIETQDTTIPPIPIPAAAPLFLSALALMGLYRRRVLRNQA